MKYIILLVTSLAMAGYAMAQMNNKKDTSVTITVYGNCIQCKNRIEAAIKVRGVTSASWDIYSKILSVVYNQSAVSLDKIEQKIANAGHDTQHKKAKDIVYNSLPLCCLYRKSIQPLAETEQKTKTDTSDLSDASNGFIKGVVAELDGKGNFKPLTAASVYWLTTHTGVNTDSNGVFNIREDTTGSRLVITYTGYQPDTVSVVNQKEMRIILASGGQLKDVAVVSNKRGYYTSSLTAIRTQVMDEKELYKAACCNLSESFETNPSVDVVV